ncbi:helix-turn-helix transcriptional regulator [Streptomyces sp. A7024]|uniref:Helix-turn-helix transcriptional regulator n=1 Tax=Streptomyces coryli TaxID=1128680 RepID=A0A6G4TU73_9ACTN|nr:AraC family transcriptional regulator [Streptomyces coryli]NGN62541.1 helix-turn-helix transcriptional regulator [Streptomyces coryli]
MADPFAAEQRWLEGLLRAVHDPLGGAGGPCTYGRLAPAGPLWRPAGESAHLLCLVVAGSLTGEVAGLPVLLSPGRALWVPPGTDCTLRAATSAGATAPAAYRIGFCAATVEALAAADCPRQAHPFLLAENAWELRPLLDALVRDLDTRAPLALLRSRSLLVAALATLLRGADREPAAAGTVPGRPAPLTARQRAALEAYADAHPAARPSVRELAVAAGLSEAEFRRRFRAAYRLSARSWLLRRRIHAAARMLDEADRTSVGAVAGRFGYTDVFLFSRQFKAVLGMSPRAWRERARRAPAPAPAGRQAE